MENVTPQIEAIVEDLTDLCCQALRSGESLDVERRDRLVESLSTNGWERHRKENEPLSAILKKRVVERCTEPGMHRGAAIEGLAKEIEDSYNSFVRFRTNAPDNSNDLEDKKGKAMPPRTMG